jgi:hypothetical protein
MTAIKTLIARFTCACSFHLRSLTAAIQLFHADYSARPSQQSDKIGRKQTFPKEVDQVEVCSCLSICVQKMVADVRSDSSRDPVDWSGRADPHLPAAKIVPLADPKVDIATESGMIQANMPSIRLPKVCAEEKGGNRRSFKMTGHN